MTITYNDVLWEFPKLESLVSTLLSYHDSRLSGESVKNCKGELDTKERKDFLTYLALDAIHTNITDTILYIAAKNSNLNKDIQTAAHFKNALRLFLRRESRLLMQTNIELGQIRKSHA